MMPTRRSFVGAAAAALFALLGSAGCAGGPRIAYWQDEPVRMDGARIPSSPDGGGGAAARIAVSREEWDARAAGLPFRAVTVSFMWNMTGLYAVVRGARLSAPIQVETSSGDDAEPAVNVWIRGHDYIRTGGRDRLTEVPRTRFEWDFTEPARAAGLEEDRFFLSWETLGMSGPPHGPGRVHFLISDDGLLEVPRGGAWLTWNDPPVPRR